MSRRLIFVCLCVVMLAALAAPAMAEPARGSNVLCYLWANNPTTPGPYNPSAVYSFNAAVKANGNTITRSGVGAYSVTCKGVGGASWGPGGHVQVTAYGSDTNYCKVANWVTGGADFTANVRCYT